MSATKHDGGKDPWHLLPFDAVGAIVKVLAFGANKYTSTEIGLLWGALQPIALEVFTATGNVARITKSISGLPTLSLRNVNEKTDASGKHETQIVCKHWLDVEQSVRKLVLEMQAQSDAACLLHTEQPQKLLTNSYEEAVRFARASDTCTLITTIRQGDSEAFCAVSTTTVSASLEMTLQALKPHCDTSALLKPRTGDRNWEGGMDWSRCFSAMQRHATSWWMGEDKDPETGFSHLWHVGCCAVFLIAYEIRGVGTDDRPKRLP